MELKSEIPPGRANRKLRAYLSEIRRLRDEGYSITGIKEVLSQNGIEVGWATVQRETSRLTSPPSKREIPNSKTPTVTAPIEPTRTPITSIPSRQAVDEFFATHIDNPLLRKKGITK